jgi:hypothetical protein
MQGLGGRVKRIIEFRQERAEYFKIMPVELTAELFKR